MASIGPATLQFTSADGTVIDFLATPINLVSHEGFEGPAVQHRVVQSPVRDGSRYLNSRYEESFFVIQFELEGASYANLMQRRRPVVRALAPKKGIGVLEYQPASGAPTYRIDALVERRRHSGNPQPRVVYENWTVQFRCPVPFWRGVDDTETEIEVEQSGMSVPLTVPVSILGLAGTAEIDNAGDLESYPTLSVTPATTVVSPTLTNVTSGETLSLAGLEVPAGETLAIDMLAQTAKLGDESVLSYLTSESQFWALEVGDNDITISHTAGDGTWTLQHYDWYEGV